MIVAALGTIDLLLLCAAHSGEIQWLKPMLKLFRLDREGNIPTWFSSMLLLLCAICLIAVSRVCRGMDTEKDGRTAQARYWYGLGLIFLLLSLDEAAGLHERTIQSMRGIIDAGGYLHFAWVVPGIIFVLFITLIYWRFVLALPAATRWLFVTAAAVYLSGALGLEMISAKYADLHGIEEVGFAFLTVAEEMLEMTGAVIFLYALLLHMESISGGLRVRIISGRANRRALRSVPAPLRSTPPAAPADAAAEAQA